MYYDGIHEPLVSQEIFDAAQKIDKTKTKKYKLYKHFLFGGLIKCQHCDSAMSPCFTNKFRMGKMRCYRYYRCTKTTKHHWSACPIKQVSAERLERYALENLERISTDTSYLENLAFRLNNDKSLGTIRGVGLSRVSSSLSHISPDMLSETLSFLLASLASAKGLEKNIIAKKCIEKIEYAPDCIKLSFWLKPDADHAPDCKNSVVVLPNQKNEKFPKRKPPIPWENRESANFVLESLYNKVRTFFQKNQH